MRPLIDADILTYQAAFGGEDRETGEIHSFDYVAALVDKAITDICLAVGADEEPTLYLTGDNNFREEVAVSKPYKGNRSKPKPFHYKNVRAYLMSFPNTVVTEGIEADDAMSIEQTRNMELSYHFNDDPQYYSYTIICTRDKDLRMVPGWHYGWEHGAQAEFFKQYVDPLGKLEYDSEKNKISGTGYLFFCSQLITGDTVDNIPGLPKKGAKAAFTLLKDATSEEEALGLVKGMYEEVVGEGWESYLLEQGRLLWMVREVDEEGKPVMWRF